MERHALQSGDLDDEERGRQEAFEIWRRMERISWTEHTENEEVLKKVEEK